MNKLIISIITVLIIATGIGAFFVFQKSAFPLSFEQPTKTSKSQQQIGQDSPFGIHDPIVPEVDSMVDVAATGAKWVRYAGGNGIVWDMIEPQKGRFIWDSHDRLYLETFKNNLMMFVTILPPNRWDQMTATLPEHIMPKDMDAYKNFLQKVVERYDGDGIEDAPGSPLINLWQIENEVDLTWRDTAENYAKLLKESYKIIKRANSQAKVAIAGVADPEGFQKSYISILKELAQIRDNPQDRYFDIFDIHWYPIASQYNYFIEPSLINKQVYLNEYIRNIKEALIEYGYSGTPIFITETAQYSGMPAPLLPLIANPEFHSEKKQANDLLREYVYSLANGIKKIFWVTLTEWHGFENRSNSPWDNIGLINNPLNDGESHKKLAYYTYKKMVEVLEGSDWNNIQTIQESGSVYVYKFNKSGKNIWVAWNDNSAEKQAIISGITSSQVKITEAVPKYESGKEVTDYNTAFNTETKTVNEGKINITLKDKPIFVEVK